MINDFLFVLQGLNITVILWFSVIFLSIPIALCLVFLSWIDEKFTRHILAVFTWVMRGSPLLLQLFFVYFGLGLIGLKLTQTQAAIFAFTINYAAYFVVIFSNAFFTLSINQVEAATALGFKKKQVFIHILLPQAIRQSIGALSSEAINLVKDSALVTTIGLADIMRNTKELVSTSFKITPYFYAFIIYLCLTGVIVLVFKKIESRYYSFEV